MLTNEQLISWLQQIEQARARGNPYTFSQKPPERDQKSSSSSMSYQDIMDQIQSASGGEAAYDPGVTGQIMSRRPK